MSAVRVQRGLRLRSGLVVFLALATLAGVAGVPLSQTAGATTPRTTLPSSHPSTTPKPRRVADATPAVTKASPNGTCGLCVLAPSGVSMRLNNAENVTLPTSNVIVDSPSKPDLVDSGSGNLTAPSVGVAGTVKQTGTGTVANTTTHASPIADPFASLSVPSVPVPSPVPSIKVNGKKTLTINPGVYGSIAVTDSAKLTLSPGTYVVLKQLSAIDFASLTAPGVTIYLACAGYPTPCSAGQKGASLDLEEDATFDISAPTASCATPVAIFSDRNNASTLDIDGNGNDTMSGLLYAKSGTVSIDGADSTTEGQSTRGANTNGVTSQFDLNSQVVAGKVTDDGVGSVSISGSTASGTIALSLSGSSGPNDTGTTETVSATLTCNGQPLVNQPVSFSVIGVNSTIGGGTTNGSGVATFTYTGTTVGKDSVQASFTNSSSTTQSNTLSVQWVSVSPIAVAATTSVQGDFFAEPSGSQSFLATPSDTPAFGQTFPTIDFNPPSGTITGEPKAGPSPTTRPFTDVNTDVGGDYAGTVVAQGNGVQAGKGTLNSFDAVFTSNFVVSKPGDITYNIVSEDGFMLGVGNGATRVNGSYVGAPASNTSPFDSYPLVGANNVPGSGPPGTYQVTVHFPTAGIYPYELDYFSSSGQQLSLTMGIASFNSQSSPLSIYLGYADSVRPAASIFPFPWEGSPNVTFYGCVTSPPASPSQDPCTGAYDGGAIRFDNNSTSPITLDSVTVDLGSNHFDIWPHSLTVPAGQIVIVTMTSEYNFDTSDFSGSPCGVDNGVIPQIHVSIAGQTTTYPDTNQVINTGGYDYACKGNESVAWQNISGGGSSINTPLPPATSLLLSPAQAGPDVVGQSQSFKVAAMDASGNPVPNLPIALNVYGGSTGAADNQILHATTDSSGNASFSYTGKAAETDTISATAFIFGLEAVSNATSLQWNIPIPNGPPSGGTPQEAPPAIAITSPNSGAVLSQPTPIQATITPPSGETIASWSTSYQSASDPGTSIVLGQGTGTPPATLATFDPTQLPNGGYTISVSATASGGGIQTVSAAVSVMGDMKLGRYVATYHELTVPVGDLQMTVDRVYDSFDKSNGDFGVGWNLKLSSYSVSTNGPLGAGGWSATPSQCSLFGCTYGFSSSTPHSVTVTEPDGSQEVFDYTPSGGFGPFFFLGTSALTPRPGTSPLGTLSVYNDPGPVYDFAGNLDGGLGGPVYDPTEFVFTTNSGDKLLLDSNQGLVSETDPSGNSITIDSSGIHSSSGPGIAITRDPTHNDRITEIAGPMDGINGQNQHWNYGYNTLGQLSTVADPTSTVTYSYDPVTGNLLQSKDANNQPLVTLTYGPDGRVATIADGTNPPSQVDSSVAGKYETIVDPNGKLTTTYFYDNNGNLVEQDQSDGATDLKTIYHYDSANLLTSTTDPLGHTTSTKYDDSTGDILSQTDADGRTNTYTNYNKFGEAGETIGPDGSVLQTANFDPSTGLPLNVDVPGLPATTYTYYPDGLVETKTDPVGRQTTYTYDSNGNLATQKDGDGNTYTTAYDDSGRLIRQIDPVGNESDYSYDGNGNLISILDVGTGARQTAVYNDFSKPTQVTNALGQVTTYKYDQSGNVLSRLNPDGVTTTYGYDADGNRTQEITPTGTNNLTYDAFGRLVEADNSATELNFSYDEAGNLLSQTSCPPQLAKALCPSGNGSITISDTVDPAGLESTSTGPAGMTSYSYNTAGDLSTVTDPQSGQFTFGYDPQHRVTSLQRPNGVDDAFAFDGANDPLSVTTTSGPTTIAETNDILDPVTGQITTSTSLAGTTSYGYDADGRLLSASYPAGSGVANEAYTYDADGNRHTGPQATTTSTYNLADELTNDGTSTYEWNGEGDLASATNISTHAVTAYSWDADGNLLSVTQPNGTVTTYQYDPLGRRITSTTGGSVTQYVWDGQKLAAQVDSSGVSSFITAPGSGAAGEVPLEIENPTGRSFPISDLHGDEIGESNLDGALEGQLISYSAFGIPNTATSGFGFDGYQSEANGLAFAGAREYSSTLGTFLSPDPQPALNTYTYANDSPIQAFDPTGEVEEGIGLLSGIFIAAGASLGYLEGQRACAEGPGKSFGVLCAVAYAFVGAAIGYYIPIVGLKISWALKGGGLPAWYGVPVAFISSVIFSQALKIVTEKGWQGLLDLKNWNLLSGILQEGALKSAEAILAR